MATIFTENYSGGYGSSYEFKAEATESNVSTANNTSKVTVEIFVRRINSSPNGAYNNDGTDWSITIDGTKTTGTSTWDTRNSTTWKSLGSASKTIRHDSDGSKKITISATHTGNSASGPSQMGNASGSGTVTLTKIARYATVSQSLKSKTSSSITMNWSSDSTIDYIWYSKDDGSNWTGINVTDGTSGNYTISSLSANTTYKIKTRVRRKDSQLKTDSSALSVTTYAKTTPTISLSSKTSSSITVKSSCNVTVSSTQYRIKKSGGSYGSYQTSATFSGLSANTSYVIEVKKVGKDSGESGTATVSVTTYKKTTPTISLSSRTVDSIEVKSSCNVTVSSTQYRIKKSGGSYGSYQTSATFSGLSANTSYVIEVKKVGKDSGESGTATLSVSTYDVARLTSYPNFNLGDNVTVKFSNPSGSPVRIGIYDAAGKEGYALYRTVAGLSYTFEFTDEELDKLYKAMNGNLLSVRYYINTIGNAYREYKGAAVKLTGNQKTVHICKEDGIKRGKVFIARSGIKRGVLWRGINGTARRCI